MQPQMVPAGSSPQQPSNVHNSHNQNGNSSLGRGKAGAAASDGAYEEGVVQTLCDAAGLKPVPQEEKLRQFLSDAPTLSPELIGFCLQVSPSLSIRFMCKGILLDTAGILCHVE